MALSLSTFGRVTTTLNSAVGFQWSYVTTDTLATALAASYFNNLAQQVNVGDIINITASDYETLAVVTVVTATAVTVARYTPNQLKLTGGTYAGGGTSTTFTITGAATTDNLQACLRAATTVVAFKATISSANTVTVTFSADPGTGTVMDFIVTKV